MPNGNTFKLEGNKLVPTNRFNLVPSKPSSSFLSIKPNTANFTVIGHPVINSINIDPILSVTEENNEHFPLMENVQNINENTSFKDYENINNSLIFPDVEILPNNNTVFYYEEVPDKEGKPSGSYFGKVTLKYNITNKKLKPNENSVNINIKEVILNLKVNNNEIIGINGVIDTINKNITFNLLNESVKVAFTNLITNIPQLRSSIDMYFEFKGFSKLQNTLFIAKDLFVLNRSNLLRSDVKPEKAPQRMKVLNSPLILRTNSSINIISNESIKVIQKENDITPKTQDNYIKGTFLLKITKSLNYPLGNDVSSSLYKTTSGGFINIPFNQNTDFSQFKQIFIPGVNFNKLSIYKSTIQPNTFLLIPKLYFLCRAADTMKPCITTIFHAAVEGSGLTEEISEISFNFALGPDLSEYDLAKLKIDIKNNNYLDGSSSDYINSIRFLEPSDIDASFEVSGNNLLQQSSVAVDGKYFIFTLNTKNLNEASLIINALNNSLSLYANINFMHKEIKDTSVIDLNIEKTIGEFLSASIDNPNKLSVKNESVSKCKINSMLAIHENQKIYFNSTAFNDSLPLESSQVKDIDLVSVDPIIKESPLKYIYFKYESIEDISAEFQQIVSQQADYSRFLTINIRKQKPGISKIQLELLVEATGNKFNIEKINSEFNTPILFNFLITNSVKNITTVSYKACYFDTNDNIITSKKGSLDYLVTGILNIDKLN